MQETIAVPTVTPASTIQTTKTIEIPPKESGTITADNIVFNFPEKPKVTAFVPLSTIASPAKIPELPWLQGDLELEPALMDRYAETNQMFNQILNPPLATSTPKVTVETVNPVKLRSAASTKLNFDQPPPARPLNEPKKLVSLRTGAEKQIQPQDQNQCVKMQPSRPHILKATQQVQNTKTMSQAQNTTSAAVKQGQVNALNNSKKPVQQIQKPVALVTKPILPIQKVPTPSNAMKIPSNITVKLINQPGVVVPYLVQKIIEQAPIAKQPTNIKNYSVAGTAGIKALPSMQIGQNQNVVIVKKTVTNLQGNTHPPPAPMQPIQATASFKPSNSIQARPTLLFLSRQSDRPVFVDENGVQFEYVDYCNICTGQLARKQVVETTCKHKFCRRCFDQHISVSYNCFVCKASLLRIVVFGSAN